MTVTSRRALLPIGVSFAAHAAIATALAVAGRAPEAPLDPAPLAAGETFELPAPDSVAVPLANASPSPEQGATGSQAIADPDAILPAPPPGRGRPAPRPTRAGRPSQGHAEPAKVEASGGPGSTAQYGAVGERSAGDLATAFTRGFPQAASADPAWRTAPLGAAGEADVVLTIDEGGRITSTQVLGSPSPALASGIRRTLALINGRQFVARGRVTRLHLSASVSADAIHDGLHGDVFAIGGSFAAGEGSGFFALAIGRRVDLRVRLR